MKSDKPPLFSQELKCPLYTITLHANSNFKLKLNILAYSECYLFFTILDLDH